MNGTLILSSFFSLVLLFSSTALIHGQDWTRFRGPNGSGYAPEGAIPNSWSDSDYTWKATLPGKGIGSPVVWKNKVFILSGDSRSAERIVLAYDLQTGKQLWSRSFASEPHHLHKRNRYASSTPCCNGKHLYVAWSDPKHTAVTCLDHSGELVWQKDLGTWQSQHGFGTSPMLFEDKLIVFDSQQADQLGEGDQPGQSRMIALDRLTGQVQWTTPLKTTRVCYGTPCIYKPADGPTQLVDANKGNGLFGLNPQTGEMLWNLEVFRMRCCSSPVVSGDLLIGSSGSGGGGRHLVAVRPGSQPSEAFRKEDVAPYVPTPVVVGDLLFIVADNGVATCSNANTGDEYWKKRIGGDVGASPIVVGGKLLTINMSGEATVLRASKTFKKLGTIDLGGTVQASPAYSQGFLLLRSGNTLLALGPPKL